MGNFNSQYQSYYSTLPIKKRYNSYNSNYPYRRNTLNRKSTRLDAKYFLRRFTLELTGVLCLFIIIILCKVIITPQTKAVYTYSKGVVGKNFDYTSAIEKIKNTKYSDLKSYADQLILNMRTKMNVTE